MPDEDVQDEMRDIIAKFKQTMAAYKEMTEQTLISVLQVKVAAAHEPTMRYVYQVAVRKEQELTQILKEIEDQLATDVE